MSSSPKFQRKRRKESRVIRDSKESEIKLRISTLKPVNILTRNSLENTLPPELHGIIANKNPTHIAQVGYSNSNPGTRLTSKVNKNHNDPGNPLPPKTAPQDGAQDFAPILWRDDEGTKLFLKNLAVKGNITRKGKDTLKDIQLLAYKLAIGLDLGDLPDTIIIQTADNIEARQSATQMLLDLTDAAKSKDRLFRLNGPEITQLDNNQIALTFRVTKTGLKANPVFKEYPFPFDVSSDDIDDSSDNIEESGEQSQPTPVLGPVLRLERQFPDNDLNLEVLRSAARGDSSPYTKSAAKLNALWKAETKSLRSANRGKNEPTILEIDKLLYLYDNDKNYAQRPGHLEKLDDVLGKWRAHLTGSRVKAAKQLHKWVRAQRLIRDTIQPDKNVLTLANNPLQFYKDLRDLRERHDRRENFPFHQIKGTLENMEAHLEEIKLRLAFGVEDAPLQDDFRCQIHANVSPILKRELLKSRVLDYLARDIEKLKQEDYPYRETLLFIVKFMKVIEYITFRAKTQPELEREGISWKDIRPGRGDWENAILTNLNEKRNERFKGTLNEVTFKKVAANFSTFLPDITINDIYSGSYVSDSQKPGVNVGDNGIGIFGFEQEGIRGDKTINRLEWLIDHRDVIVFPSYQALDAKFFNLIRSAPIFVIGMINVEYLNADNVRQSPGSFFTHDFFHVIGRTSSEANKFLYDTMEKRRKSWTEQGYGEENVYQLWARNGDILR